MQVCKRHITKPSRGTRLQRAPVGKRYVAGTHWTRFDMHVSATGCIRPKAVL